VLEALREGQATRVMVAKGIQPSALKELEGAARRAGAIFEQVPRIQLDQALRTTNHQGVAAEIGHLRVQPDGNRCGCGNRGCLQALASGPAIANRARAQLRGGPDSLLLKLAEGHPERIMAETVFAAAEQGDEVARHVVDDTAIYLGIAIANLVNLFNPALIVLGGPVGQNGQVLLEPLRAEVQRRAMAYPLSAARIVNSTLGPDAGAIGAAVLVLQHASELLFARN